MNEVLAYVAGKTKEENSYKFELHLAECSECARRVNIYYNMKENFDKIWDSWTGSDAAAEVEQTHILESISGAEVEPGLSKRFTDWKKNIRQKTLSVVGIRFNASRKKASVFKEGLEGFLKLAALTYTKVKPPVEILGAVEEGTISIESRVPYEVKVTIDPSARRIVVQGPVSKDPLPMVVLVPKKEWKAYVEEFRRPEEADYILAEFEEIPDGEYYLLLESVE
jgi:hypothetical protein